MVAAGSRILVSRVVQVLANAAVVLLVAKTLGPEQQGHYSLTVAAALLLASLLAGGQGLAAVPPLRQGTVPAGRILAAQLLWAGAVLVLLAGLAAVSLRPGPAVFLADHLGWDRGLGFVVLLAVMGILCFEIFSYDLLARGRLVVGAVVNGVRATTHLTAVAAVSLAGILTFGRAVTLVSLAQAFGGALVIGVLWRELRRGAAPPADAAGLPQPLPPIPVTGQAGGLQGLSLPRLTVTLARRGWLGQISAVAYFLLLRLDQGILEHFRGAAEVGIYSVAVYAGEMLWLLPGALTPLLVHSSAEEGAHSGRDATALRAVRLGILVTLAAGVPLYLAAGPLLAFLAGGAYAGSGAALRALLPGIIAFAPGAVLAGDFIGRGKPHWNTQASVATVGINIVAAMWLIPRHGAVGAGWASSIAYACGSVIMIVRFLHATGFPARALLGRD